MWNRWTKWNSTLRSVFICSYRCITVLLRCVCSLLCRTAEVYRITCFSRVLRGQKLLIAFQNSFRNWKWWYFVHSSLHFCSSRSCIQNPSHKPQPVRGKWFSANWYVLCRTGRTVFRSHIQNIKCVLPLLDIIQVRIETYFDELASIK